MKTQLPALVAQEAKTTFLKIRQLRKTMPTKTSTQRLQLATAIRNEKNKWWTKVKPLFTKEKSYGDQKDFGEQG
jgi:hypothetical protein